LFAEFHMAYVVRGEPLLVGYSHLHTYPFNAFLHETRPLYFTKSHQRLLALLFETLAPLEI